LRFDGRGHEHAPASTLVAAYLLASTIPLASALWLGRTTPSRLAMHALFLALAVWSARRRGPEPGTSITALLLGALAAWIPLLLVPGLYNAIPTIALGLGGAMHDARVLAWEHALFGVSPALTFSVRFPWPALSETLHAGYLSYYALIFGPPLRLFLANRRRDFGETAFTVMLAFVCCYVVFVLFPVQGPWFEWAAPTTIPRGPVRLAVERLLHAGSSRGTAFPSSHVAVSVSQTIVALRLQRGLGVIAAVCTLALALGAVYGSLHYGIDVIVGALLGVAIGTFAPGLYTRLAMRSAR
jgi:membrane-associated phospholipid phosphatase